MTNRLEHGEGMITVIFDDEWPLCRTRNDDEDCGIAQLDVHSREMDLLGSWLDHAEMNGTNIFQVDRRRPRPSSMPAPWGSHDDVPLHIQSG